MEKLLEFEQLCPFVREVGMQHGDLWQIPRRIYDHQLMLCLTGRAIVTIGSETYELSRGMLAVIPPDTPHTIVYPSDEAAELAWMHLDFTPPEDGDWVYNRYNNAENYLMCFASSLPHPEHIRPIPVFTGDFRLPPVVSLRDASDVEREFMNLYREFLMEGNSSHFVLQSRVSVIRILDALLEACGYWKPTAPLRVAPQMISYIQAHYMEPITQKDICSQTPYHVDYAAKLFRNETGSTVIETLNRYRIDKAQAFLMDESRTISSIAEHCGFQSENYFSYVVKKITGRSPRDLRAHLLTLKNDPAAKP